MSKHKWSKGREPWSRIFDADGNEHTHLIECDTESGRVRRYVPKEANPRWNQDVSFEVSGDHVVEETYIAPAPLRVEPCHAH